MILGTAAYMSPEQARGKPVDKRTDIWAFGVVLFKMLTGKRLFQGENLAEILASVVKDEPRLDEAPAKVRRLLQKCLEKDPKKRLRDIGDAWDLLEDEPIAPSWSRLGMVASIAAAAFAIALAVLGSVLWHVTRPVERPLVRLVVDLGPEVALPPLAQSSVNVALSPDGTRLLYPSGDPVRLFVRRLDQSQATELPGTDEAYAPFFSPDGQWVGFAAHGKLNKIPLEGGPVIPLADMPALFGGASWGADGNIFASMLLTKGMGLVRIPESGGTPTTVLAQASGETALLGPQILPGDRAVLFVAYKHPDLNTASVDVLSFADGRRKTVLARGTSAHYLASGHLVYLQSGTLFAIPFDLDRLETRGKAVPILDDIAWAPQSGYANLDSARNGALVYRFGRERAGPGLSSIQWLDGAGKRKPMGVRPHRYADPRLSPDGKRLALIVAEGRSQDVWVYDLQRDAMARLTFGAGIYTHPVWTPDGQYLFFGSVGKGIYLTRADGAGTPQPLMQTELQGKLFQTPFSFAPDGRRLAYQEDPTILTLPVDLQSGELKIGEAAQFLSNRFTSSAPAFSPDGRWLAYVSNESGMNEVDVRAFPPPASGEGAHWQISNGGGELPVWSRSRQELIYKAGDQLMLVSYAASRDSFVASKPRVWIAKLGSQQFDLAQDGNRVVVVTPVDQPDSSKTDHEVVLLENFFDYLRRRVPTGK
jgi:serine/threonine-protein kinase